jgi:hypothetical protein
MFFASEANASDISGEIRAPLGAESKTSAA